MKSKKIEFTEVEYWDLEAEIKKRYGVDVELVACEEWRNDVAHPYYNLDGELDEWNIKKLGEILLHGKPGGYGTTIRFLNALIKDGYIEPGNYLVRVFW